MNDLFTPTSSCCAPKISVNYYQFLNHHCPSTSKVHYTVHKIVSVRVYPYYISNWKLVHCWYQWWSRGRKARGQGQGHKKISRPRTPSRGQGQGPRTKAQVFSKKKKVFKKIFQQSQKKVFKIFFQAKKVFKKFFSRDFHLRKTKKGPRKFSARFLAVSNKISTVQKVVLSSSRGQGDFRGLEASRPRPRTSKCVLGDVLDAKDVLEDSTSGWHKTIRWANQISAKNKL